MAPIFSNPSLFGCVSSFPSIPFHSLKPNFIPSSTSILGFSIPSKSFSPFSVINPTPRFNSCFASHSHDSFPIINDEMEDTQNDVGGTSDDEDRKQIPTLIALIEAYKEAILHGDERAISSIEVRIQSTANKRSELIQKVSTLSAEKVASKEKLLRLQADFDNFRKRSEKERLNIQSNAQEKILEKLLLMVDNFERYKQQIKATTEKEKKIDISYQGIYKQFVEVLRSHHVSVVPTVGKPFNPLLHEAIGREESQDFKEGIIIKESRRGFLLRDRVLRPALVKVSLGPGNKKSTVASDKSQEQPSTAVGIDER
ncbi:putative GrpE nucleotide exchange factor [Lupinus albus]|uniref:GrpE protein homolog n=1 Tax=Lupinus albus TaxID=3870 RepID=A0A6A4PRH1_LUPAL|nr:putative GrpE nucleotide exchange factor [Lupinus albus]